MRVAPAPSRDVMYASTFARMSDERWIRNPGVEVWARMSSTVEGEIRTSGRVELLNTRGLLIELNRYVFPVGAERSPFERLSALFKHALPYFEATVPEHERRYFIVSNTTFIVETYAPVRGAAAKTGRFRIPNAADERVLAIILTAFVSGLDAVFATASEEEHARLAAAGLLLRPDEVSESERPERGSDPWLTAARK